MTSSEEEPLDYIQHHRTETVHEVDHEFSGIGTKTECGMILPHSPDVSSDENKVQTNICTNCTRAINE